MSRRVAIVELNSALDIDRLRTIAPPHARGIYLFTFFDLTAAQRQELQTRVPHSTIVRLAR